MPRARPVRRRRERAAGCSFLAMLTQCADGKRGPAHGEQDAAWQHHLAEREIAPDRPFEGPNRPSRRTHCASLQHPRGHRDLRHHAAAEHRHHQQSAPGDTTHGLFGLAEGSEQHGEPGKTRPCAGRGQHEQRHTADAYAEEQDADRSEDGGDDAAADQARERLAGEDRRMRDRGCQQAYECAAGAFADQRDGKAR
jgi:hypothetical protein